MWPAGDEVRRTQRGNNNAWCQDNDVSWFDWRLLEEQADFLRFVRELVRFRRENPTLRHRAFLQGGSAASGTLPDVEWFSADGSHIDWYAGDSSLCCFFGAPSIEKLLADNDLPAGGIEGVARHVFIVAHSGSLPRTFRLPAAPALTALPWRLFLDTAKPAPDDIHPGGQGPAINFEQPLELPERSLVCLVADALPAKDGIAGGRAR
jgi:isoamylase